MSKKFSIEQMYRVQFVSVVGREVLVERSYDELIDKILSYDGDIELCPMFEVYRNDKLHALIANKEEYLIHKDLVLGVLEDKVYILGYFENESTVMCTLIDASDEPLNTNEC